MRFITGALATAPRALTLVILRAPRALLSGAEVALELRSHGLLSGPGTAIAAGLPGSRIARTTR